VKVKKVERCKSINKKGEIKKQKNETTGRENQEEHSKQKKDEEN